MSYRVAVVGATGAVGQQMLKVLEERKFPCSQVFPIASERSAGRKVLFAGSELPVTALCEGSFSEVDLALFSAGTAISKEWGPRAVKAGTVVVDNSKAWRMDPETPLVVPEVNPNDALEHKGLIANPNCSTIQMVVALNPLHAAARLTRVIVSTYQSVSGTGLEAMEELRAQMAAHVSGDPLPAPSVYPHPIAFECLPHIDVFDEGGHSLEEIKMVNETRKILHLPHLPVSATCVRVPVLRAHSEAVWASFERPLPPDEARSLLQNAPGIEVIDAPNEAHYPLARRAEGTDATYVGRIREDLSQPGGLALWVVADNLRKGAATNAVQIAEVLHKAGKLRLP